MRKNTLVQTFFITSFNAFFYYATTFINTRLNTLIKTLFILRELQVRTPHKRATNSTFEDKIFQEIA